MSNARAYLRAHASARMRRRAYPKRLVCRRIFKSVRSVHTTIRGFTSSSRRSTNNRARHFWDNFIRKKSFLITRRFSTLLQTLVFYLVMYITSYSIRIVLLSRYVNIYDTMAPMSMTAMLVKLRRKLSAQQLDLTHQKTVQSRVVCAAGMRR